MKTEQKMIITASVNDGTDDIDISIVFDPGIAGENTEEYKNFNHVEKWLQHYIQVAAFGAMEAMKG